MSKDVWQVFFVAGEIALVAIRFCESHQRIRSVTIFSAVEQRAENRSLLSQYSTRYSYNLHIQNLLPV